MLFGLCALQVAGLTQAQEGEGPGETADGAKDLLAPFARLTEGQWRVDEIGMYNVYHRFDWGPGKRSLLTTSYNISEDGIDWPFQQGVYYLEPGSDQIQGLRWEQGKVYDDVVAMDGDSWEVEYQQFTGKSSAKMTDRWDWADDGQSFKWTNLLEGDVEWIAANFVHEPRGRSAMPITPDADVDPRELSPLAWLAGKQWDVEAKTADGRAVDNRVSYEWGVNKSVLIAHTHAQEEGGEKPTSDTYFYWHGGENAIRATSIYAWGLVTEGTVRKDGDKFVIESEAVGRPGVKTIEHVQPAEDGKSYQSTVWAVRGDSREQLLDATYRLRPEPEADGEGEGE